MARRLIALALVVIGCGTGAGGNGLPVGDDAAAGDAATDAGRTPARWQSDAAQQWAQEMSISAREMRDAIDRSRPMFDAEGVAAFDVAWRAYRSPTVPPAPADAGLEARQAYNVERTISDIAPAYCACVAAFRLAALGHPLTQPAPRIGCNELPPPDGWWTRWP